MVLANPITFIYSDCAGEIKKACDEMLYPPDTSTPHRPQSNGVGERAVRKVKEGTRTILAQSGLMALWWNWAMPCFCFLYNIVECVVKVGDRMVTPYEARFEEVFLESDRFQFGCEVEYLPSNPDYTKAQHKQGSKMRSGIFFGYHQKLGGRWSGDLWVADWEQMERAAHPTHIVPTRIRRGDVVAHKLANGRFRVPIAEGALKLNYIKHRYADVDNSHKEFRTASQIAQSGEKSGGPRCGSRGS